MRNNQRTSNIHTLLFILLCIALAVLASAATFRRGRAARQLHSGATPVLTTVGSRNARLDGNSERPFRAGRLL